MKEISKFLTVDISIVIIGLISGLLSINREENRKKSKFEKFTVGLSGFISAVCLTPLIVWITELCFSVEVPHPVQLGIAYTVGQVGFRAIDMLFDLLERFKKLKDDEK